jgi:hypothetical protein
MRDGLWLVVTPYLCAGFVVQGGCIMRCAPILLRKLHYWTTQATWVAP